MNRLTSVAVSAALSLGFLNGTTQAGLLYQWDFNAGNGANTGSGTGGTLALDVGVTSGPTGYPSGSFNGAGVSGNAGDYALDANNAYDGYWGGASYSPITNAAGISNLDMVGVNQFTITMWIKRNGSRNVDLLNIGNTTTPGQSSDPGISIGLDGTWANGVRVGVNGHASYTGDLWSAGTDNDWVFLSVSYDGTDTYNVYEDATMNAIYGRDQNVAIATGNVGTPATVTTGLGLHVGDYWTPTGTLTLGSTSSVFLANDGATTNGFMGLLDDVRIYDSLLTVSDIEAVRGAALLPEPTGLSILGFGALVACRRKRAK